MIEAIARQEYQSCFNTVVVFCDFVSTKMASNGLYTHYFPNENLTKFSYVSYKILSWPY